MRATRLPNSRSRPQGSDRRLTSRVRGTSAPTGLGLCESSEGSGVTRGHRAVGSPHQHQRGIKAPVLTLASPRRHRSNRRLRGRAQPRHPPGPTHAITPGDGGPRTPDATSSRRHRGPVRCRHPPGAHVTATTTSTRTVHLFNRRPSTAGVAEDVTVPGIEQTRQNHLGDAGSVSNELGSLRQKPERLGSLRKRLD